MTGGEVQATRCERRGRDRHAALHESLGTYITTRGRHRRAQMSTNSRYSTDASSSDTGAKRGQPDAGSSMRAAGHQNQFGHHIHVGAPRTSRHGHRRTDRTPPTRSGGAREHYGGRSYQQIRAAVAKCSRTIVRKRGGVGEACDTLV